MKDEFGVEIARPGHMLDPCENSEETMMKVARYVGTVCWLLILLVIVVVVVVVVAGEKL